MSADNIETQDLENHIQFSFLSNESNNDQEYPQKQDTLSQKP